MSNALSNKCSYRVVIDTRADIQTKTSLENLGFSIVESIIIDTLYDSVASHPDMMIHYIKDLNMFIAAPEAYEHFKRYITDINIIKGSKPLNSRYPDDIAYNIAAFGNYAVCKTAYTTPEILSEYKSLNKVIVNVNQGYSKCSICTVGENAVITSDPSIYNALSKTDIDILKIREGFIKLRGLSHGFIGGATGVIKNTLLINGNIKTHPDCDRIISFCKNHGVYTEYLKSGEIEDIGSILAF